MNTILSDLLRTAREKKNMTQETVATEVGCSPANVGLMEREGRLSTDGEANTKYLNVLGLKEIDVRIARMRGIRKEKEEARKLEEAARPAKPVEGKAVAANRCRQKTEGDRNHLRSAEKERR